MTAVDWWIIVLIAVFVAIWGGLYWWAEVKGNAPRPSHVPPPSRCLMDVSVLHGVRGAGVDVMRDGRLVREVSFTHPVTGVVQTMRLGDTPPRRCRFKRQTRSGPAEALRPNHQSQS